VFLVGVEGQTEKRLRKIGIMDKIPPQNIIPNRTAALRQALANVDNKAVDLNTETLPHQGIG